ncbi:MAG: hypothetical protein AB1567_06990 [bacterium]
MSKEDKKNLEKDIEKIWNMWKAGNQRAHWGNLWQAILFVEMLKMLKRS